MNGVEHYREAEKCLDLARGVDFKHAEYLHREAQTHATLALAAATAFASAGVPVDGDAAMEWRRAIVRPKITNHPAPTPHEVYECCASGSCEVCRA